MHSVLRLLLGFRELAYLSSKRVLRKVIYEQNAVALVCNDLHGMHVGSVVFTGKAGN